MNRAKLSTGNGQSAAARENQNANEREIFAKYSEEYTRANDIDNDEDVDNEGNVSADGGSMQPQFLPIPFPILKGLKNGCYLTFFHPVSTSPIAFPTYYYQGTIRVEKTSSYTKASGDLYYKSMLLIPAHLGGISAAAAISPAAGIPIFSIGSYRYYLRVTKVLHGFTIGSSFDLEFQMHKYDTATKTFSLYKKAKAKMSWTTAPSGYPDAGQYLKGTVKDIAGVTLGTLTMGWVDKYFRKATVEIDTVAGSEAATVSGTGENWQTVGEKIGWRINGFVSNTNVPQPSGDSWSDAEMHSAMLVQRGISNLDKEWRYHLLCVKRLDSTERGIMYDAYGTDSNNVPREGAGISSHWVIPNTATWGLVRNMRFGTAHAPYFRTAVHEIGHAMGLYHNSIDNGYMHTTPDIAASATAATPFPNNIKWNYAPNDQDRLRHFPDIVVRPGGTPFGISYGSIPIADEAPHDESLMDQASLFDEILEVNVQPIQQVFPLGAPVRFDFSITNVGSYDIEVPESLSMKRAEVFGFVTDPSGSRKSFSPLIRCIDAEGNKVLKPGKETSDSLTLLRGKDGALFLQSGYHSVDVYVQWDVNGTSVCVKGSASVMISGAADEEHARVAKAIFDAPDAHLVLVFGGDHLTDGVEAIQQALKNSVLKPHYAYVEAKRLGKTFGKRKAQKDKAKVLLTKTAVVNSKEKAKMSDLI